jgi:uncharacterized protein YciI
MRHQEQFDEHADFMDGLVDDGFIVLGGPLGDGHDVLLVVAAPSDGVARSRLAGDPWWANGMLKLKSIEQWTVLLDGVGLAPAPDGASAGPGRPRAVRTSGGAPGGQVAGREDFGLEH